MALACCKRKIITMLQFCKNLRFPSRHRFEREKAKRVQIADESSYLLGQTDSVTTLSSFDSSENDSEEDSCGISVNYLQGQRPNLQFLLEQEASDYPSSTGVFCCVPSQMKRIIYNFASERRIGPCGCRAAERSGRKMQASPARRVYLWSVPCLHMHVNIFKSSKYHIEII